MTGAGKKMIWVVTTPYSIPDELHILRKLFSAGLETLLLRKPGWSAAEYEGLLQAIPAGLRDRVMLSGYPELVERYGLRGLHLSERLRNVLPAEDLVALRSAGFSVSTSVHAVGGEALIKDVSGGVNTLVHTRAGEGVNTFHNTGGGDAENGVNTSPHPKSTIAGNTLPINPTDWDFLLLGPVFDSISKAGYKGRHFSNLPRNAIAIGGITPSNLEKLQQMGFYGAAMLGAIWQKPERAVEVFIKAKTSWK
ncbi:MAG: thiamine phosphate synthase [Chitinophaga sp.]